MKNILILNVSRLNTRKKTEEKPAEHCYSSDIGVIKGINTNDAPAKYIIKMLNESGKTLDLIICIKTPEAESAYEMYRKTVADFCGELKCPVPDIVPVSDSFEVSNFASVVRDALAYISGDCKIYLDTTGGSRNSSYFLMFMVRFLEYEGIRLEKAVYSIYNDGDEEKNRITDVTELYNMFDLINAANTFTSFGNADQLSEIFKDTKNENIRNVIDAMTAFSDSVMLCKTNLSNELEHLNRSLAQIGTDIVSDDAREILFCRIVDIIRKKFNITDEKPDINYPDIIRWCLENDLIQQAITIYAEKIPEYLYQKKYFIPSENIEKKFRKKKNCYTFEYQIYYDGFVKTGQDNCISNFINIIAKDDEAMETFKSASCISDFAKCDRLAKLLKMPSSSELISDADVLLKLKNILYDTDGNRKTDKAVSEALRKNDRFRNNAKINDIKAKRTDSFVNYLKDDTNNIQSSLFGKSSRLIYVLSNFDKIAFSRADYSINENISGKQIKEIVNDSIYIKKWIRNVVNHASDENEKNEKLKEYFESVGYDVSENFHVKEIKKILLDAVDKLVL